MRKLICSIFALTLLLTACGGKESASYTLDDGESLLAAGLFEGDMVRIDTFILCRLYGIDLDLVDSAVSYQAANTAVSADELTIFILTDEDAARTAESACLRRIESQIAVCQDYCPPAVPRLEEAVVSRVGNTVLLAVGNPETLPGAVVALHQA